MTKDDMLMQEWKDVRETLRYFGTKRFAQMTVFLAASGVMLNEVLHSSHSVFGRGFIMLAGLILGILFLIIEYGSWQYFTRYAERGKEIERDLAHLRLMSHNRPLLDFATWATFSFYIMVCALWLILLAKLYIDTRCIPNASLPVRTMPVSILNS